jgi:hypothetical protein
MPAEQQDLLDSRRRQILASLIAWCNAHYDEQAGLALSGDRHGHVIGNVQYAVALAEAAAGNLDAGLPAAAARARAVSILTRLFAGITGERPVPRYHGPGAPDLPVRIACDRVLWPLAYLLDHREALAVPAEVASVVQPVITTLLRAREQFAGARQPRPGPAPAGAGSEAGHPVWDALRQAAGFDVHWTAITASAAVPGGGYRPLPRPVPVLQPGSLSLCPDIRLEPCQTLSCRVPCLNFDTASIDHCPTWADACASPHVDVEFFKGDRGAVTPVVFVGGWEPQYVPGPGGLGFGPNTRFSTLPPAWQHGGTGPHPFPPILADIDVARNDLRTFYGLSTMLRCGAGYDHVRWSQSDSGGPIQTAINELAAVIKKTKAVYGVPKVILVCHSRGGLVARKYIVNQWKLCGEVDVEKIITLGTPHLGAQLAYLAADSLLEIMTGGLQPLADALLTGMPASPLVAVLDVVGAIDPSLRNQVEEQLALLAAPLLDLAWPGYAEFVLSGEEMRPDSAFITGLNDAYGQPVVPERKTGKHVSFWQAIPHVLIAGTAPDLWTLYLGCWLPELSLNGIWQALQPQTCWTDISVDGVSASIPYPCWYWRAAWFPVFRCLSTLTPFLAELAQYDTFREGLGDAVVARYSALAEGITGAIRRAEYQLEHFALVDNSEQQAVFDSPAGAFSMNTWQLRFHELGIAETTVPATTCASAECDGFTFQNAF